MCVCDEWRWSEGFRGKLLRDFQPRTEPSFSKLSYEISCWLKMIGSPSVRREEESKRVICI